MITTTDTPFDYAYSEARALTLGTLVPGIDYTLVRNNDDSDHGKVECFFAMQDDAARYISRLEAAFAAGVLGEPHFHPGPATLDLLVFTVRRV